MGLIVNRLKGGAIGRLCAEAARGGEKPRYILQGRDENTGRFRPGEGTVRWGDHRERLVR